MSLIGWLFITLAAAVLVIMTGIAATGGLILVFIAGFVAGASGKKRLGG